MSGTISYLLKDDEFILATALAFTLELSNQDCEAVRSKYTEKKPTEYFSRNDSDIDETYRPQCDVMMVDPDICILEDRDIPVSNFDDDIVEIGTFTPKARVLPKPRSRHFTRIIPQLPAKRLAQAPSSSLSELSIIAPNVASRRSTRVVPQSSRPLSPVDLTSTTSRPTRVVPQPTRCSSRVLFRKLQEDQEKEERKKSSPSSTRTPKQKPKKAVKETLKEKKKRISEANKFALESRKQRKLIDDATKSTLRAFGLVASANSKTGRNNIEAWRSWHQISCRILRSIHAAPSMTSLRSSHFNVFLANSVTAMENTMLAARPRPPETHEFMMRFIVDFNKIWEFAFKCGGAQVMGDIGRLVEKVVGKYLSSDKLMCPTHLPWIQTKEIFELLLSAILRVDTLYDLLGLINRMLQIFIMKFIHRTDEHQKFKAYAISQLIGFTQILSRRLTQLMAAKEYNM